VNKTHGIPIKYKQHEFFHLILISGPEYFEQGDKNEYASAGKQRFPYFDCSHISCRYQ
jgi:hypothetical protein